MQHQVYNFNIPTFGPGVVYDVDQKVRTEQFRFFAEALKKERLKKYVPQFVMEAEVRGWMNVVLLRCLIAFLLTQNYFAKWGETGIVDFAQEFANLIVLTAARTLLGECLLLPFHQSLTHHDPVPWCRSAAAESNLFSIRSIRRPRSPRADV